MENLKITLKGWNLAMSVSKALPFTCSVTQLDMMNVHKDAVDGCDDHTPRTKYSKENRNLRA